MEFTRIVTELRFAQMPRISELTEPMPFGPGLFKMNH